MSHIVTSLVQLYGHLCAGTIALACELSCTAIMTICNLPIGIIDKVTGSGKALEPPAWHPQKYSVAPIYQKGEDIPHDVLDEAAMAKNSDFPIAPETLIASTKKILKLEFNAECEEMLHPEFQFVAPIVGPLPREEFLKAIRDFDLKTAFPDLKSNMWGFHVDPMEPNRVWYFTRSTATHTGVFNFGRPIPATGKEIMSPPQAQSMLFDADGKVYTLTVGYSMDRRIGNTGGLGGLFGFLYAVGNPLPFPEGKPWAPSMRLSLLGRVQKGWLCMKGLVNKDKTA